MTREQRTVRDEILQGRRGLGTQHFRIVGDDGQLLGPFGPMVMHPAIGQRLQALGASLRFDGCLSATTREIVICTVAVACESAFEWYAHAALARSVGVTEAVLDRLKHGHLTSGLTEEESATRHLAVALLAGQAIGDDVFAAARDAIGIEGVVEVVALVGYYRMLADLMRTFELDVSAPEP